MTLDELNLQFANEQREDNKRRTTIIRVGVIIFVLLMICCLGYFKGRKLRKAESDTEVIQEQSEETKFLPVVLGGQNIELSDEELELWFADEENEDKIYIDIESQVPLYGTRAYVDMVNPIYNAYPFSFRILSQDEKTVYLEHTSLVEPGMTMKAVELENVPKEKNSEAVIELIFFKDSQEELGRHKVKITLTKQSK